MVAPHHQRPLLHTRRLRCAAAASVTGPLLPPPAEASPAGSGAATGSAAPRPTGQPPKKARTGFGGAAAAAAAATQLPPQWDARAPCPCGSGEVYGQCCRPFHAGGFTAASALAAELCI